jgi:hypothetical protein
VTAWIAGGLTVLGSLLAETVAAAEPLVYPGAVTIERFEAERVIVKPGEDVRFQCDFTSYDNHESNSPGQFEVQIWIERQLEKPTRCAAKPVQRTIGANRVELTWKAERGVFGHRATVKLVDGFGRVLAERSTLFDVAENWVDVMRLASLGASHAATAAVTEARMAEIVGRMRRACFNAFEVYTFSPKPYVLAPPEPAWPYQHNARHIVLKEKLLDWAKVLHQAGMKYVAYNETSAAEGPADWHVYRPEVTMEKPYAHYFADKGMFTPNSLKIAPLFAEQLAASIRMFGWDGILMDSAFACHINTAKGVSKDGQKLTDLSPGEVGALHLRAARQKAREVNPDFAFLSQNATSISHVGVKLDADKMYPWIRENAAKLQAAKYSEYVDSYTLEIDAHNEPRDGRYPLTYEKMSVALNSLVESTGRPLLSWAFIVTPYYDEYSVSFVRPYMALIFASRTKLHDHFDFYGGAASSGADSPASRQFSRYNRFAARFSYYLWNPRLKWVVDPAPRLSVEGGSRPLFWARTVYRMDAEEGRTVTVVNLLNLPSNGLILAQKEIPDHCQNGVLRLAAGALAERVTYLNADDESLAPLDLVPAGSERGATKYNIPPVEAWSVIVIQTAEGAQ